MNIQIGQVITQIISFLLMLWILNRFAFKPIMKTLDDRRDLIKAEFDKIETEKQQLNAKNQEYEEKIKEIDHLAHQKMQESSEAAKVQAQKIQDDAQQRARNLLIDAQENIQKEITHGRKQLKNELINMTMAATEKILKKNIDQKMKDELLTEIGQQVEAP